MLLRFLVASFACWARSSASPVHVSHVVHERRDAIPSGWTKRGALESSAVIPVRIALAQENLHRGHTLLMEVSQPGSEKYGQHWAVDDVATLFAPSDETIDSVKAWLAGSGIANERIVQSRSQGWLKFHATIEEAERLLKTKYHIYEHEESGQPLAACEEYSVPASLREKIDFITPTLHFDVKVKPRDGNEIVTREHNPGRDKTRGNPGNGWGPKIKNWIPFSDIIKQLKNCDTQITPWCLRLLYKFPPGTTKNPGNSLGIVEYSPQAYVPSDLDLFFTNFSTSQIGDRPILNSIDGGIVQQTNMSFNFNGESNLDLEYAMTLIYPQTTTLFQVGDLVEGASFNDFLDGIDAAYCTYDGGDDPVQDAVYPDPAPGGYTGAKDCGKFGPTKIISTSYGYNEHDLTPAYEQRQCYEYMKLGLMGVTVLYSSGDYGVAGNSNQCINGTGSDAPYQDGSLGGRFNPSFPGGCPFVTSVGATQVKPGTNILTTPTQPEQACETVIYSGGGFSNVFPLPDYQTDAVQGWFEQHPPPYTAAQFNDSQQTRGFPDISANGANYVVAIDGRWALVYGTSASAPTLGAILTLINEARLDVGKGSVGFINPVAYAHPEVFNDITEGSNPGCGTEGFEATTGWDPVTGLGTPNFPKMRALFLSL